MTAQAGKPGAGILVSVAGKVGVQAVNLLCLAILARILAPDSFGLIAMVMAVVGIGMLFKDMGIGVAIVYAKSPSPEQLNALFWISAALGAVVSVIVYLVAPLVAALYSDARLLDLTRALAATFLLTGLSVQPLAILRRALRFDRLAVINIAASLIGQVAAIVAALNGWGYWALVLAALITPLVTLVMALAMSGVRISAPVRVAQLGGTLKFAGQTVVFALLGFAALNAHNLILGLHADAAAVGLYHRAFVLLALLVNQFADPLALVATAELSRLRDRLSAYRDYYLDTVSLFLAYAALVAAGLFVCADDIVAVLLGPNWEACAPLLRIFAIAIIPQVLCVSTGWLYLSNGDTRGMMWWGLGGWGGLTVMIAAAAPFGMEAMAMAYSGGMFVLLLPCMGLAFRKLELSVGSALLRALPSTVSALLAAAAAYALQPMLGDWPVVVRLLSSLLLVTIVYAAMMLLIFGQGRILALVVPKILKKKLA